MTKQGAKNRQDAGFFLSSLLATSGTRPPTLPYLTQAEGLTISDANRLLCLRPFFTRGAPDVEDASAPLRRSVLLLNRRGPPDERTRHPEASRQWSAFRPLDRQHRYPRHHFVLPARIAARRQQADRET